MGKTVYVYGEKHYLHIWLDDAVHPKNIHFPRKSQSVGKIPAAFEDFGIMKTF